MIYRLNRLGQNRRSTDPSMWVFIAYFVIFILLFKLSPSVFGALTLGWYLSMIIEVPARALSRVKFISYKLAVVVSSIFIFAILVAGISLIIPILIDEGGRLFDLIVSGVRNFNLRELFNSRSDAVVERIVDITDSFLSNLGEQAAKLGGDTLNWVVQRVPDTSSAMLIFVITASYFTTLSPLLKANLWRFFPRSGREKAYAFVSAYYRDLRHFIGGQVVIAAAVGVLMGLGMLITGIPYPLFLGFLAGITNFIPFLGVIIAGIPALLVGLTRVGIWGLVKVLAVIIVTNQIETWVLAPRIQGRRMKLNWFAIIIGIFFCAQFFGIVGVLLAIPLLIFFRDFWIQYVQKTYAGM